MGYVVGVILIGVIAYLIFIKRNVERFNSLCLLQFQPWLNVYRSSGQPQRTGISRAFLLQTLHLAENLGVLNKPDRDALESEMRSEDPSRVVDEWLEVALPHVIKVAGSDALSNATARDVGLYMLICVMGVNAEGDLRKFLSRFQ